MAGGRLEILKNMVEQNPSDSFSRYALAMEHRRLGDFPEAAAHFAELVSRDETYVPAYFQYGQTLEKLGDLKLARTAYETGIRVAERKGESHAAGELRAALDLLQA